MEAEV